MMNSARLFSDAEEEESVSISAEAATKALREFYHSKIGEPESQLVVVNKTVFPSLHTNYVRGLSGEEDTSVENITHYTHGEMPPTVGEISYYTGSEQRPTSYHKCNSDPTVDDIELRDYQRGISVIELSTGGKIAYLHLHGSGDYAIAEPETFHQCTRMLDTQTIAESEPGVYKIRSSMMQSSLVKFKDFDKGGKVFHQNKTEVEETIEKFFQNVDLYLEHGGSGARSCLLYGEPGTGKTQLIRTLVAEHASDKITSVCSTPGDLTKIAEYAAEENMPTILALEDAEHAFHDPSSNLLNWMDGTEQPVNEAGTFLIYTTNHLDKISAQVRRPGRIDKEVYFGPLDEVSTLECLNYYLPEDAKVTPNEIASELKKSQPGAVLRDLVKRAQSIAISGASALNMGHIEQAINSIEAQKKDAENYEFAD